MALGDTLAIFTPLHAELPASGGAEQSEIVTDTGERPVLLFDDTADETAIFSGVMSRAYAGTTGITVDIYGAMASANTTDDVVLDVALELLAVNTGMGAGGSDFAAVNSVTVTADDSADDLFKATVTFTDGADMDAVAGGSPFRLKITRDADNGSDTAAGDFQLIAVEIRET